MQSDWREGYIICEHIAQGCDLPLNTRTHRGRVCCGECFEIRDADDRPRFLFDEELDVEERGPLAVGRVKP